MEKDINKIVWICNDLIIPGGGERLLLEGINYFNSIGITAKVLVFRLDEDVFFNGKYNIDNVVVLKSKDFNTGIFLFNRFLKAIYEVWSLRKYFFKEKPDVILTQSYVWEALYVFFATLFSNFKYYLFLHGTMFQKPTDNLKYFFPYKQSFKEIRDSIIGYKETVPEKLPKTGLIQYIIYQIAAIITYIATKKSQLIFVMSKSGKWEIKKLYNKDAVIVKGAFPKEIFNYVPKSTIAHKFKNKKGKTILSICRLIPKKRVDLTIKGFSLLKKNIKNIFLIIGGTGPEKKYLEQIVKKENIQDSVQFLGFVNDYILWDYMKAADVFVQPDIADFNITPYEALALGTKVIWTNEMDIDKYLKNNPFIFKIDPNPQDMANAIESAIKINGEMPKVYLEKLKKYSWDEYFSFILKEIRKT